MYLGSILRFLRTAKPGYRRTNSAKLLLDDSATDQFKQYCSKARVKVSSLAVLKIHVSKPKWSACRADFFFFLHEDAVKLYELSRTLNIFGCNR